MKLVVGTNSYMTLQEAEQLVADNFMSSDSGRIYWNTLSNDDKSISIVKTTKKFDSDELLYIGVKADSEQDMQFPRLVDDNNNFQCPDDIKTGIIMQMIYDISKDKTQINKMIDLGIETLKESDGSSFTVNSSVFNKQYNKKINGINRDVWNEFVSEYSLSI